MRKSLISLAILVGLAGSIGCHRSIEPKTEARTVTFEASTKPGKAVHLCAGKDKDGSPCKRRVKNEGDYCWMHKDQDKRVKK